MSNDYRIADGTSTGDPGPSGAGVYIKQGKNDYEYAFSLGVLSNHEAEFYKLSTL